MSGLSVVLIIWNPGNDTWQEMLTVETIIWRPAIKITELLRGIVHLL